MKMPRGNSGCRIDIYINVHMVVDKKYLDFFFFITVTQSYQATFCVCANVSFSKIMQAQKFMNKTIIICIVFV